jgi:hypothetical protein
VDLILPVLQHLLRLKNNVQVIQQKINHNSIVAIQVVEMKIQDHIIDLNVNIITTKAVAIEIIVAVGSIEDLTEIETTVVDLETTTLVAEEIMADSKTDVLTQINVLDLKNKINLY